MSVSSNPNSPVELVTRLRNKKNRAYQKCKTSEKVSNNANRRAKQAFFNTVNSTMKNAEISAKKKFNILTKLMKNQKQSTIPPLN